MYHRSTNDSIWLHLATAYYLEPYCYKHIVFFLLGPPVIRSTPTVKAIEGQRLQVSCPASGYPIEQITWQKGNNFNSLFIKKFLI